jgi:hypothetical protein
MKSTFDLINFTRNAELIEDAHLYRPPILNLILTALLESSFLKSEQCSPRITNQDVMKLVRGRLSENLVIHVIQVYESDFDISSNGLLSLRKSGIGDSVIAAMLLKASASAVSVTAPGRATELDSLSGPS